ncbi:MAG: alpha/beta fold hydrolase, partial [Proteobacteria bacterium]|nr:alpha/beta fold hydrolase [Pseudomonadota bacterium]
MELNTSFGDLFAYTGARDHKKDQPAVVFIHGTGMDHTVWVLPSRYFARHGFNVMSIDLPGHGKSSGASSETIDEMADAVIESMHAAGISNAAIVGHSMGSLVALSAAARYPDRARSLALIGTTAPMGVHPDMMASAQKNDHDVIDMITYWGYSKSAQLGGNENPGMWM